MLQRLPPEKTRPTGEKANRHDLFLPLLAKVSLRYDKNLERSQADPPNGLDSRSRVPESGMPSEWLKIEARLENSLGMSKVRSRRSRGIPPKGRIEPLDSIERDQ